MRVLEELPRPITLLTGNDNFIFESFVLGAQGALIGFGAIMTREQVRMIEAGAPEYSPGQGARRRVQRLADVVFAAPVGDYRARMKERWPSSASSTPPMSASRCYQSRTSSGIYSVRPWPKLLGWWEMASTGSSEPRHVARGMSWF